MTLVWWVSFQHVYSASFTEGHYNDLFYLQCTAKSAKVLKDYDVSLLLPVPFGCTSYLLGLCAWSEWSHLLEWWCRRGFRKGLSQTTEHQQSNRAGTWSQCTNLARPSPAPPSDSELCSSSTFESPFSLWRWSLLPLEGRRSVSEDDSSDEDSSEDDSSNARGLW